MAANDAPLETAKKVDPEDDSEKPAAVADNEEKKARKRSRRMTIDEAKAPDLAAEKKQFTAKQCYLLIPASLCDMAGTSIMYTALTLTSASSFQMLRGGY